MSVQVRGLDVHKDKAYATIMTEDGKIFKPPFKDLMLRGLIGGSARISGEKFVAHS